MPIAPMFHANAWGIPYVATMVGAKLVLPGKMLDGENVYNLIENIYRDCFERVYIISPSISVDDSWKSTKTFK